MPGHSASTPIFLFNIGQLLTLRSASAAQGARRGTQLRELGIIEDGAVLCVGGKITSLGTTKDALRDPWIKQHRKKLHEIDCTRKVVLPGFVDSHTHPAFISPRLTDFEQRVAGATYEEIAAAGGGIRSSIDAVRRAGKRELTEKILRGLQQLGANGTTTVEAKSGYGLSLESELKSLEAIRAASAQWPGTVVPTLLAAHVLPPEYQGRAQQYVKVICDEMIPLAAKRKLAKFVDVFCDRGAFSEEDSLTILGAGRNHVLKVRAHISQLISTPLERVLSLNPLSLDHLDHVSNRDIQLLAKSNTVATLVPGANYFLGLRDYPPARKLIEAGAAIALATDYNPGSSPTVSMPFVLSLACTQMKMSPAEAIAAATINGACALGLQQNKGSIEPGKDADLAIFDVDDYRELAYWIASQRCDTVVANGTMVEACSRAN
jgi:imidazolonepropionase